MADRKCTYRRCENGTIILASGAPTVCQPCGGTGRIPSVADVRKHKEEAARRYSAMKILFDAGQVRDGRRNGDTPDAILWAIGLLEKEESHRLVKLWDSVHAGRVEECIDALLAYLADSRAVA